MKLNININLFLIVNMRGYILVFNVNINYEISRILGLVLTVKFLHVFKVL